MGGLTRSFNLSAVWWTDYTTNPRRGIWREQMERMVSMAEACIRFEELMREVAERHETIIVEQDGQPRIVVLSVEDYRRLKAAQLRPPWEETRREIQEIRARIHARRRGEPVPLPEDIIRELREERGADSLPASESGLLTSMPPTSSPTQAAPTPAGDKPNPSTEASQPVPDGIGPKTVIIHNDVNDPLRAGRNSQLGRLPPDLPPHLIGVHGHRAPDGFH
jgi:prevent-host-death family protein